MLSGPQSVLRNRRRRTPPKPAVRSQPCGCSWIEWNWKRVLIQADALHANRPFSCLVQRGADFMVAVFGLQVIAYELIRLGKLLKPAMAQA